MNSEEILQSSIRVRNLLANTPDDDDTFHNILYSVIRSCIRRLDANSMMLYSPTTKDTDASQMRVRQQIQGHTIGSLAHASQRLRRGGKGGGGGTTTTTTTALPGDAAAWLYEASQELNQLQSSITRTMVLALIETGIPRASVVSPCLSHIFAFLDTRYRNIVENDKAYTKAAQRQLISTSWIVIDILSHNAGMKAFQDWEGGNFAAGIEYPPWNNTMEFAAEDVVRAVARDGAGTLDLFLDIILFWPTKTPSLDQGDNLTGMSIEGLSRMNHRCREGAVWNELYLRHIKYAFTKYALGVSVHEADGLFRWQMDRAILIAVVAATTNAAHGRLAYGFVAETMGPHPFDETRITSTGISLSLAINLLLLVLGDERASLITEKYSGIKHIWEPLLGPRPTSSRYRRAPLPTDVSKHIARFLQVNMDVKHALGSLDKGGTDATAVTLYLDLAVQMQDPMRPTIFWGINLLRPFFSQLCNDTLIAQDIRNLVCSRLIATTVSALEIVQSSKTPVVDGPHIRDHDLPLGVPADFSDRDDLNGLLLKHRTLQRKRALLSYEVTEARKGMYQMIEDCVRLTGAPKEDPLSLPIAMFKCIASEDRKLCPSVADTLKSILIVYKDAIFCDTAYDGQSKKDFIAPLLPSLICAIASDSTDSRDVAEEWTKGILIHFDFKMAGLILNFLNVEGGTSVLRHMSKLERQNDSLTRFFDFGLPSSINGALYVIFRRMKVFADCVAISPELSLAILVNFKFSPKMAKVAFDNDKASVLREVGMACRAGIDPGVLQPGTSCRICFDDFNTSFALSCGHRFCTDCWKDYLSSKTSEEQRRSIRITCPDHNCDEVMSLFDVERIDPQTGKRLVQDLVSAFVECDPLYSACPKVGCPMVAWREIHQKQITVVCDRCDHEFCFDCGGLPHRPAACKDFTRWSQIFGSSSLWIRKNTKPCPSCAVPIEKARGCNHIRCQRCGADWCWICLRYLRSHMEAHVCNQYNGFTDEDTENEQRSIFFTDRYQAHEEAEFVAKQRAEFIQNHESEISEGLWYADENEIRLYISTFDLLVTARSFLKFSYVAAWSLHEHAATRFQHQQAILEVATEMLTQLTMSRLDDIYNDKGYPCMQFVFRSISFHSKIVRECIVRLSAMN